MKIKDSRGQGVRGSSDKILLLLNPGILEPFLKL